MADQVAVGIKFGGDSAELVTATAAGERAWGKLSGAIDAVQSATARVSGLFTKFGVDAPGAIGKAAAAADGATSAFVGTQNQLSGIAATFPRLAALAGPLGLAIAGAAAVAGAAWVIAKDMTVESLGLIDGKAATVSEVVSASFGVAKDEVVGFAKDMAAGVGEWFAKMPKDANGAFEYLWDGASKVFTGIADFAGQSWQLIIDTSRAMVQGVLAMLPAMWDGFKNLFVQIGNMGMAAWDSIRSGSTEPLKNALKEAARSVVDSARNVGAAYATGFKSAVTPGMQAVADGISATFDRLKNKVIDGVRSAREAATATGLTPRGGGGGGDVSGQELVRQEQALQAAITAMNRAGIEARRALELDALDQALRGLQQNYQLRRVAEVDYINQSADLQRQKVGRTVAALTEEYDATVETVDRLQQQWIRVATTRGAQDKDAIATLVKINDAQGRQLTLAGAIARAEGALLSIDRDRQKALDAYADKMTQLQQQLDDGVATYRRTLQEATDARAFDLSLVGKTAEMQSVLKATHQAELEVQRIMNQLAQIGLDIKRQEAVFNFDAVNALTLHKIAKEQELAAARQNIGTVTAQATEKVWAEADARIQEGLTGAMTNAALAGKNVFKAAFDYLKQEALRTVLKIPVQMISSGLSGLFSSVFGGGGGAGGGLLSGLFGGGSSGGGGGGLFGNLLSGAGDMLGSGLASMFGMNLSAGFSGIFGGFSQLVSGTMGGMSQLGLGFGEALGGAIQSLGGFGAALGAALPVIGAIVAIASALGVFDNPTGTKIDNSVTDGNNRQNIVTGSVFGNYDISGDLGNDVYDPLIKREKDISQKIADAFLDDAAIAKIQARLQAISSNATDWFGYEDEKSGAEAIAKASKTFLQQRFSTVFDEIDARVAATIRGFEGDADALLAFLDTTIAAKETIDALTEAVPGLTLTLSGLLAATDEQRNTLTTLGAVFKATTSDYVASTFAAIAASKQTLAQALTAQGAQVTALTKSLDGSLASAQALAAAEQTRLQMVSALIAQIGQIADEVSAMFTASAEDFRLATMSASEQYDYYDKKSKATFEALSAELDPTKIKEFAATYNAELRAAWNLLTAEQKAAAGDQFAALADAANKVSQEQLDKAREATIAEAKAQSDLVAAAVKLAMEGVVVKMEDAADKIAEAAQVMKDAANTPVVVHGFLDTSSGVVVPLDRQAGAF